MSDPIYALDAGIRKELGKGAARRMRKAGQVPAVLYGAGKDPQSVTLAHNKVIKALENESFFSHILTITIDNKPEKVILKDLMRHPFKPKILHMDFQRVSDTKALHVRVPIHFIDAEICAGVKAEGGIFSRLITDIEVSCLPANLPEFIAAECKDLGIGDSLTISQLTIPEGVEALALIQGKDHDYAVATVIAPRGGGDEEEETTATEEEESTEDSSTEEETKGKETKGKKT